jgi:hypothetical protein
MECFVKSQFKAKAETLAWMIRWKDSDPNDIPQMHFAKPGQTLVTSPDINIFELGPVARYLRAVVHKHIQPTVYLHGGKTINQMSEWSKQHALPGKVFTCDFSAYDQSCTEETLAFELCFFDYAGIPKELYDLYFWIKINMRTQFGFSAVMRFTGEFGTYDFNTFWNMAYMTLRYRFDKDMPCAFSGDDSLFFGVLKDHHTWPSFECSFTLVGKTAISSLPEFCGWLMYPIGVIRHPILLALKIVYREARGNLDSALDNYFLEALFAHRLKDDLYDYLPPLALEAQSWVINYCYTHSILVPHLKLAFDEQTWRSVPLHLLPSYILKEVSARTTSVSISL